MSRPGNATPDDQDQLLTPAEAAARLRISRRTLDGHVASGGLRYISVGLGLKRRRMRFDPADLDRFLEGQRRVECPPVAVPARRRPPATGTIDFQALLEERRAARRAEQEERRMVMRTKR